MILATWTDALILLALIALARLAPRNLRHGLVACASVALLARISPGGAAISLAVGAFALVARHRIERGSAGAFVPAACAVIAVLVVFQTWEAIDPAGALRPLGLSYLCFHALSSLIETRRGRVAGATTGEAAAHLFLFATAPAGPIKNFDRFRANLAERREWIDDLAFGARRILVGIAKTRILAASLKPMTAALAHPADAAWLDLVLAVWAYTFWIYFDFSGYTDAAIGMARLAGYRVEENFDRPYLKANIRDFWRAWHMSLTAFLRDAVYIPLGGNRAGRGREIANTAIVFAAIGAWHGFAAHYLIWGLWHAVGLIVYRAWRRRYPAGAPSIWKTVAAWALTLHFVAAGWVFFACDTRTALAVFARLFTGAIP
ncbi:MAG: MBOAT family protein [Deltaproteobacteria bacterium]|nr:MBOAT family protein [Deltaproteobacteria bacterium]